MRERHDPDLEDQAERSDGSDDAVTGGDLDAAAARAARAGQAAGISGVPVGGPALPTSEDEEEDREDPRLR